MGHNQPFEKPTLTCHMARGLKGHLVQSLHFTSSKLRLREVKSLAQGHIARKSKALRFEPRCDSAIELLPCVSHCVEFFKFIISCNTHCGPMKHVIIPTLQTRKRNVGMGKMTYSECHSVSSRQDLSPDPVVREAWPRSLSPL